MMRPVLPRAIAIVLLLAACALMLCGCDAFYPIVVENHSDQTISLDVFGGRTFSLKPCYVSAMVISGPLLGTDNEAHILSESGDVLVSQPFRLEKARWGDEHEPNQMHEYIVIRYPAEGSLGCGEPGAAGYLLTLTNETQETLDITIGGVALEHMLPDEERQVLLEEGTPYRPAPPVVLDAEGNNRFRRGDLKYSGTVIPEHPVDEMARVNMYIGAD